MNAIAMIQRCGKHQITPDPEFGGPHDLPETVEVPIWIVEYNYETYQGRWVNYMMTLKEDDR